MQRMMQRTTGLHPAITRCKGHMYRHVDRHVYRHMYAEYLLVPVLTVPSKITQLERHTDAKIPHIQQYCQNIVNRYIQYLIEQRGKRTFMQPITSNHVCASTTHQRHSKTPNTKDIDAQCPEPSRPSGLQRVITQPASTSYLSRPC